MYSSTSDSSSVIHDTAHSTELAESDDALGFEHALGNSVDAPRLLVFTAAGRTCACELSTIREIIPNRRATPLPGAPSFVTGLINLRGSIITVLEDVGGADDLACGVLRIADEVVVLLDVAQIVAHALL